MGKSMGVGHVRTESHGGKLTENVTQAVARDVLFDLLMRIEAEVAKGWPARPVLHVHDEVVLEVPAKHAEQVLADTIGMMSIPPSWGDFLVIKGEGAIMERYGK
jgi:DNA polymerase